MVNDMPKNDEASGEKTATPGYKVAWKNRRPTYRGGKTITVRADAYDALNSKRGDRTWTDFLCLAAGIKPPPDRRKRV